MSFKDNIYDVIIIGGGPAGYTAGIYTSRARLSSILVESLTHASQAAKTDFIANYPGFHDGISGFELISIFKKQAEGFGLTTAQAHVKKIELEGNYWKITAEFEEYKALSLIIATGAQPNQLNVPGEDEFLGKGVSYCATCDGAFFKEKNIVVVGGGDTAVQEALFLTKFCSKVTLIHRKDRLRANKTLQEKAFANPKIDFIWNSQIFEIAGNGKVESVKLINTDKQQKILDCHGVFIFVGHSPATDIVKGIVNLDEGGYIIVEDNMRTSKEGIFACGDCRKKTLRQIINACGDGAVAAFTAQHYIENLKGIAYK